ncbi:MAG: NADH-quinone oxidoreductase subunit M [Candidatus Sericytochromatia bacterium]|nr:NADH-quinone oxidoreductase subunit M [Candidatus Sericytochromatia bacterium]
MNPYEQNHFLLAAILLLPMLGALVIALAPNPLGGRVPQAIAAAFAGLEMILVGVMAANFVPSASRANTFEFMDKLSWIPQFNIQYQVAVDGLSLPMVVLTALLMFVAVLASGTITKNPKLYFVLLMVLESAVIGVFTSLDLFLFFVMWELELIPMYFLIGMFGGKNREYAAMKFILYTGLASALMLIVFLSIYFLNPAHTFDFLALQGTKVFSQYAGWVQVLAFAALLVCFAVKLPMVPFHTWLPDAHVEAPTAVSVLLAGVLLKMGAYGMIRFNLGLFGLEAAKPLLTTLAVLAVINIVYGAFLALAQTDIKRVIAYSSISHMGFVLLGIAAMNQIGLNGAVLMMFSHGLITAMLFLFVGVIYDRTHTREIKELGGLAAIMPTAGAIFVFTAMANVGVPGLSGFAGEFLVFLGAFQSFQALTIVAATSLVLTAAYTLWLTQRVWFQALPDRWAKLTDLNGVEAFNLLVLAAGVLVLGIYPALLTDVINPATTKLVALLGV